MSRADEIAIAIRQLDSRDPNEVVKGLNLLLQVSFETENGSYHVRGLAGCLYLDAFPELALAIGSLLDVLNPIGEVVFRCYEDTTRRILHEWVDPNAVLRLDDFEEEEEDEWRVSLPGQLPGQEQLIKVRTSS